VKHSTLRRLTWLLSPLLALVFESGAWAAPPLPNLAPARTVGTINCASSTCHGSITPWNESTVLQNEYTTWSRLDRHAKAYQTLLTEESRRIARNLGLKEPAHKAQVCLDCHAHAPAPAQRGARHVVAEGVGCEACHGPAEKWIGPHTVAGTTHAQNVANGLYPTSRPADQARLCLSCHFGDESRFVSHRIMGAGHPRLSFELRTFASLEPAHYLIDDDYVRRKGRPDGARIWAIGQALAARQLLETLADPRRGRDGLFPELVLFDCHACHHPMSDKRWSPRTGTAPGVVRLNDSNLLMVRSIMRVVAPAEHPDFDRDVATLHRAVAGGPGADGASPFELAKRLSGRLDRFAGFLETAPLDAAVLRRVLLSLVDETKAGQYTDYAGAEQAYMAVVNVANGLAGSGALRMTPGLGGSVQAMRTALASDERWKPDTFERHMAAFRAEVQRQAATP
jgi:hypothetical protein